MNRGVGVVRDSELKLEVKVSPTVGGMSVST
jgi:hypothetical protein